MSSLPDRLDHGSLPPAQLPSSRNPTSPGGTSLFGSRPGPSSSKPPPPLPEPAKQQSSSGSSTSSPRGRPALKSQLLMKPSLRKSHDGEKDERTSGSRDESSERGVFAMDVDYDEGSAMAAAAAMSSPVVDPCKANGRERERDGDDRHDAERQRHRRDRRRGIRQPAVAPAAGDACTHLRLRLGQTARVS